MEKAEYQHAEGCLERPAAAGEDIVQLGKAAVVGQHSGGHVAHQHYRNHDFVCGEAKNKCHYDDTVNPYHLSERIEKVRTAAEHGYFSYLNVGKQPYDDTERSRYRYGTSQHEDSSVKDRTHDHAAYFGFPVGRQLQHE